MQLVLKNAKVEIWAVRESYGTDFYVYGVYANGSPRVCPSLGMAMEIAAGA